MVRPEDLPPPEDEQFYNNPLALPPRDLGPTLNTNNVLWYFNTSQFFDHTSNNASLIAFGSQLPPKERLDLFRSRTAFEDALRSRFPTGVQYVVVEEAKGPGMPWVIQRQNRYVDSKSGKTVVDVEGTFYSVGTTFYKAASLGDIVKARLLTISTQMQTFLSTASQHIHWTPSTGSTYFPPRQLTDSTTTGTQAVDSPSQSSQHHQKTTATASSFSNNASLLHSLALTNAYGHEYADENPLHGEPGAFVFASTTSHVEARNKAAAQAQAQAQAAAQGTGTGTPVPGSGVNSVAATPGVGVEGQSLSRKGSVVGIGQVPKVKRRKSKGPGSPVTPGAGQA